MGRQKVENPLREIVGDTYARLRDEGIITHNTEGIAYTQQFESLFSEVREQSPDLPDDMGGRRVIFKTLVNLRKQGKAVTKLTPLTDEEKKSLTVHQARILHCLSQNPWAWIPGRC
jgi:hypothetical protein